jgi:type III pantothenate kinase
MNLALDIGNTRSKIGLFRGKTLVEQAIWRDWTLAELLAYGNHNGVQRVIFSSVAEEDPTLAPALREHFEVLELRADTPLPFQNLYQTPQTLGKDRLAGVAGAQALFPGKNCLVTDCGTCIKYELLSAEGRYLGGNIAPGAAMRLRAMHHFTARLPEAAMRLPEQPLGSSTETALQNGALRGALLEMSGFFALFQRQLAPLKWILSGGDAAFFYPLLKPEHPGIILQPDLTLFGLNHILRHNFHSD